MFFIFLSNDSMKSFQILHTHCLQSKNCYEKKPKNVYSDEISKYSTNEIEKVKFKGTEASK